MSKDLTRAVELAQSDQALRTGSRTIETRVAKIQGAISRQLGPQGVMGMRIFSAVFAAAFAVGLLILVLLPPKYSAMTVLAPQPSAQDASPSLSMGDIGAGLGGLSSILKTKSQTDNLIAFQALLGTSGFADYLIKHDHFDRMIFPRGMRHSFLSVAIHALFRQPTSNVVTTADVQTYLQSNVYIQAKEESALVQLTYANKNRDTAIGVLRTILYSGDRVLREREATSLDVQIKYLSRILQATTDIEQLSLFRKLLGEKLASKVLIDTQETYAFKIFDVPFAPSVPNSPNIAILIVMLTVVSLMLAAAATVGWLWLRGS